MCCNILKYHVHDYEKRHIHRLVHWIYTRTPHDVGQNSGISEVPLCHCYTSTYPGCVVDHVEGREDKYSGASKLR